MHQLSNERTDVCACAEIMVFPLKIIPKLKNRVFFIQHTCTHSYNVKTIPLFRKIELLLEEPVVWVA